MNQADTAMDPGRAAIKAAFIRERGYWRPWVDTLLRERPRFVQAYADYAGHPARTGPLSARMVELLYVALDASGSHLFEAGLRTHMAKALESGATRVDVFDVLHLVCAQGLEAVVQAAVILAEESRARPAATCVAGSDDPLAALAQLDPAFAAVVREFLNVDTLRESGPGLTPAEQCLVRIALNACFTAHQPAALRQHLRQGLTLGLSTPEMLQAIQLGAHLAVHGTALGAQVAESLR